MSWKWNQFWKRTIPGSIVGLFVGLIIGLMSVLIGVSGLLDVLACVILSGVFGGLVTGLLGGFIDKVKVGKAFPNQGIKLSRKNSLAAFLVTCWTVGLSGALILGLIALIAGSGGFIVGFGGGLRSGVLGLIAGLVIGLVIGLVVGLAFAVVVGLNRGGSAVIKHYALRLTLRLNGYTPFKIVTFLDHCAKLILLKKVGGGYIFIHRMLLEYFADLTLQSTKGK
jgi:eukaryotic-like serine/threonine-protein kinase